jgi:prephenate dehydrogenase
MAKVNVTIIGLQRLGASFGLALRRAMQAPGMNHEFVITGSDQDTSVMKAAVKLGAIDRDVRDPEAAVEMADLVVVTAPYGIVGDLLRAIGPVLKPGAVVMDTSPLKLPSIQWAKAHFRRNKDGDYEAYLVGVTPILNPQYVDDPRLDTSTASTDLFDRGQLVLSPAPDCPQEAVRLIAEVAALLNLNVHFDDPAEHDGLAASMEGLPLLLQLALFRTLYTSKAWGDLQRLGNPDFSLTTYRLAQAKAEDLGATVTGNRENTLRALDLFMNTLAEIRDLLTTGDDMTVAEAFDEAMQRYARWQTARQKNDWGDLPESPSIPSGSLMGSLGGMFVPFGGRKKSKDDDKKQK